MPGWGAMNGMRSNLAQARLCIKPAFCFGLTLLCDVQIQLFLLVPFTHCKRLLLSCSYALPSVFFWAVAMLGGNSVRPQKLVASGQEDTFLFGFRAFLFEFQGCSSFSAGLARGGCSSFSTF